MEHGAGQGANPSQPLYDMHCHLDFAGNLAELAEAAARAGVRAFSNTVTPRGYEEAVQRMELLPAEVAGHIRIGVGLHPWWLADGSCTEQDIGRFEELAGTTRYIGEVGLDFAPRRSGTFDTQVAAFERVLAVCADGGRVLSIHAVRSAGTVLDLLERHRTASHNACVFHWFSGTGDELARALRIGCYVSVGTRMLATRRGRALVRMLPPERLLLETDLPDGPVDHADAALWLDDLARALQLAEDAAGRPLANDIARTSRTLLKA